MPKFWAGWVKDAPSGNSLLIGPTSNMNGEGKTIILSNLTVLEEVAKVGLPSARDTAEFLRKLLIGQYVGFRVDRVDPSTNKEYGTVLFHGKNVASLVSEWAMAACFAAGCALGDSN